MSNLLEKASIITTPTAYNDGKLLSVKPNTSAGDFDFTRNSSATRVASNGLIEDVQILSGNLVTNGDFDTDTAWSKVNSTISGGLGNLNGTGQVSMLTQNILTNSKIYKATFTVSNYNSLGNSEIINNSGSTLYSITTNGTFTFTWTNSIANSAFIFRARNNAIYSVDNVSVIEITDDTNLPRIDYTGGVGHILLEPQSTNLVIYSEDFSQSYWTKQSGITATYNTTETLSPDGTYNATKFVGNGTTGVFKTSININGVVSRSFYLKSVTGTTTAVFKEPNTNVPAPISLTITNEWQRFEMTGDNGTSFQGLQIDDITSNGLYMWGAQLEQQSFATSYIPTNGSTVTRLGETLNNAGSSDLINSTEGVLYAEIKSFITQDTVNPNRYITLTNDTSNERVALLLGGNPNQLRAIIFSSTQSINLSFTTSLTEVKQFNKLAIKYKSGDYAFFLNGIKIGGSNETNIFSSNTLNDLSFDVGGGTQKFFGKTKCVAVFKEALTDAELTCLTTV